MLFRIIITCLSLFVFDSAIAKDTTDPRHPSRSYRRMVLPNQMQVFLVSDKSILHSAASLSVEVGSLNDPEEHPGMAHFLEHMLFLGTKKYPEVGAYQKFVHSNDGYSNAYTASDHTNYHFQIANDHFEEALDRFAQFFVAPLFSPEFVEREQQAVDSEHSKNLSSDFWRIRQLKRSMYDPKHPANGFATGNSETLKSIKPDTLRKFYAENYSSNLMNLVVLSNQSLDALEASVRSRFEEVLNHQHPIPQYPATLLPPSEGLRELHVVTIKDERNLSVSFPLPAVRGFYHQQPLSLLSFMLGHEGKGSLLSLLKKHDLATSLSAGSGMSTNSNSTFEVSIGLTLHGLKNYREVLKHLFAYLAIAKQEGLPKHVYEENKRMSEIDYQFEEKKEGAGYVSGLAALLHYLPLDVVEKHHLLLSQYDPRLFQQVVQKLTAENMLVVLGSQDQVTDRVEPYYQTNYALKEGDGSFVALLNAIKPAKSSEMHLPKVNPFIPQDLALLPKTTPFRLTHQSYVGLSQSGLPEPLLQWLGDHKTQTWPNWETLETQLVEAKQFVPPTLSELVRQHQFAEPKTLLQSPHADVWFQQDLRFRLPKAAINLVIYTPEAYRSPKHAVLTQLYVDSIEEALNEFRYTVQEAGLHFNLSSRKKGIELLITGYSDRMLELLKTLTSQLKTIDLDEKTFAALLEKRVRGYENFQFHKAYQQAFYTNRLILEKVKFSVTDYAKIAPTLSMEDVQKHASQLYEQTFVQGVIYGNLKSDEAKAALSDMIQQLGSKPLSPKDRFVEEVITLKPASNSHYSKTLAVENSAMVWNNQVGVSNPTLRGKLLVISRALRPHFYTEMRTKQQLGYIVDAGMMDLEKTLSLLFLIQSGQYSAPQLAERVETYLPQFLSHFAKLSDDEFVGLRQAVINAKLERSKNMSQEAKRLLDIIINKDAQFDHASVDIQALQKVTHPETLKTLNAVMPLDKQKRLQILLSGKNIPVTAPTSGTTIESISQFKEQ